jgi:hypothetical protein
MTSTLKSHRRANPARRSLNGFDGRCRTGQWVAIGRLNSPERMISTRSRTNSAVVS